MIALFQHPHDRAGELAGVRATAPVYYAAAPGDWPAYAGTWAGLKWSPLAQITPANVKEFEGRLDFHTGDIKRPSDPGEPPTK